MNAKRVVTGGIAAGVAVFIVDGLANWLLLMERYPKDNPVRKLFRGRDRLRHLAAAMDMILNSTILDDCWRVAHDFRDRARLALADLPPLPARDSLVEIADYVVERRS